MLRMKKYLQLVMALLACTASVSAMAEVLPAAQSPQAPDFTLTSVQGSNVKLSELRGSIVLVNFWASWCGPCRTEMPALDQLSRQYADLGVVVLGVNVETESDGLNAYLSDIPVSFPVLLDQQNIASKAYSVEAMPTTVIIDKDGKVRALHRAYQPGFEKKYEEDIHALLAE